MVFLNQTMESILDNEMEYFNKDKAIWEAQSHTALV